MKNGRSQHDKKGSAAIFTALALPAILCATALVLDGGILMGRQRQTQAVADAAAHAAACLLAKNYSADAGLDPSSKARTAALSIASANGYTNDLVSSKVVINIPPTSGTFSGKSGNAEAIVTFYQPRYFSAVMGSGTIPVTARAVGRVVSNTPASLILTDPSSAGAFTITGSARLTTNGAIQVNSSNAGAVNASNGGYVTDNGGMNIVGNYSIPNWATSSTFFSKAPLTGQAAAADPYTSISPPPVPSTAGAVTPLPSDPWHYANVSPGVFNGGLNLSAGGMKYTMAPGIYYMKGGGFTVSNGTTLTGSDVMIYLDSGGGSVSFQGGTIVNLSAPSSGTYKGIVYYQDRGNTTALNNIANGSNVTMTGAVYAPNAPLAIAGGAYGSTYGTQMIIKSLNISNGVNVTINTTLSASTTSAPFLSE